MSRRKKGLGRGSFLRFRRWLNLTRAKKLINFLLWVIFIQALLITFFIYKHKREESLAKLKARQAAVTKPVAVPPVKRAPAVKPRVKEIPAKPIPKKEVKIAIVIDDWGYNLDNVKFLGSIKEPFTLAVLPHLNYSKKIAELAEKQEKEVIVHMPMEPKSEEAPLEKDTILTSMKPQEARSLIDQALKDVPGAKGMSNHMGSKATEDRRLMEIVFERLKKNNLYFLDSWTGKSACKALAKRKKLNFARRDVFLDNENDPEYIKGQFEELIAKAKSNGSAIGIGHDRINTFLAFEAIIPEIKKDGIELVFVSEIAKED